jgi:hypothetical protein
MPWLTSYAPATILCFGRSMTRPGRRGAEQPLGASGEPKSQPNGNAEASPSNAVVLALVVAILELEQRRDRGMVVTPMSRRRPE